jgi:hypothetical protein
MNKPIALIGATPTDSYRSAVILEKWLKRTSHATKLAYAMGYRERQAWVELVGGRGIVLADLKFPVDPVVLHPCGGE